MRISLIGLCENNYYMEGDYKFPLMTDQDIDEKKQELMEKYKHYDGERVRFQCDNMIEDSVSVGDKLVWEGSDVKKVEILDPERRDKYYRVVEVDDSVDYDDWVCYANVKLTGKYNFDEL